VRPVLFAIVAMLASTSACGGDDAAAPEQVVIPPTPAPTPAPTPVDPLAFTPGPAARATAGISLPLGKCVNMGNMLEAPREGEWGRKIVDEDFTIIRNGGFASVRIPVRFYAFAAATPPYTIDPVFMARVRHVVDTAVAAGLNVIIDNHHHYPMFIDEVAEGPRFVSIWNQIGIAFADEPSSVWFELVNEPHGAMDNADLVAVFTPALQAIRTHNPTRPVIIGGKTSSIVTTLKDLEMPDDPYVVPTFHYYEPQAFTMQRVGSTTFPPGQTFGSNADAAELNANLQMVRDYMQRTGRVPFVGEFGAHDLGDIPVSDRARYYGVISSAMASIGVQSCAWAYTNTFKLRDGDQWLPGMLEALQTTTTLPAAPR
jgi:endoglucanase